MEALLTQIDLTADAPRISTFDNHFCIRGNVSAQPLLNRPWPMVPAYSRVTATVCRVSVPTPW